MENLNLTIQLWDMPLRFGLHVVAILAIVFVLYLRGSGSKEFCFSYVAIGLIVFALCYLLEQVRLELGFALGLFAIFGIIRYRTITMPIKEMTYLFVVIGMSVINALAGVSLTLPGLALANFSIFVCLALLEVFMMKNRERSMVVRYEKIENLRPENRGALIRDLKERLGLDVKSFYLEEVDFLRDTTNLRVYFEVKSQIREVDNVPSPADSLALDR